MSIKKGRFVITCGGWSKLEQAQLENVSTDVIVPRFLVQLPLGRDFATIMRQR